MNNNIIKIISYEIKKNYSIKYEEHNYNYNNRILEDIKYKGTLIINRNCSNPIYFKKFLFVMCIKENKFNLKGKNILINFKDKYGDIKFKIQNLSDNFKKLIINKYKIKMNIKDLNDKTLNQFITPDLIANSVSTF